ncbi:hypothetical protein NEUTE1DRAFT_115603 [Neurospora tetrasperma FGSC 2508]|uniref:Uncharacterized protein n=1 Tax=Neurospora tetrasperma (strain FGSC 2508 / ATCC MYA-4615 / P0657) TaxID=510951 RepID=F8MF08_NEUT8|nr:uncharacterized protein NEUTE1DRAFT_115603 [Neurospora tetrasperma FGSC 2508]EGO60060.1 hypothetical protein NEUTE1DRAFT_115603 [Neurospora tetrasperma FGSC 2508]
MESGYVLGIGCMSVKEIPSSALIRSGWWWGPMMLDVCGIATVTSTVPVASVVLPNLYMYLF